MESPPTGGLARRNKLLVSWGPLVIGTVRVAFCNAATVGFPVAKMTSGASATNSFAYRRWRSVAGIGGREPIPGGVREPCPFAQIFRHQLILRGEVAVEGHLFCACGLGERLHPPPPEPPPLKTL